ncbi:MAG: tRNA (N(6)-L-threonylcarbamoyladenosine(37)-C(2))-methylthiotransferase MtaB [Bdellovibrionaceae bacterium]|nr:tRNA (N(6)-L-threonylcarbamoyladenosine(37)-C(2))-methylthiotransferase MtaB [Bdellovibrionales bacterium]MCB9083913.1 tRNA (N(6)-L-threonylcarbamoyladenosine(37)-C(2))-methylthiotransferase MtaB [Pseudobdellovibrionaceae bacterium]
MSHPSSTRYAIHTFGCKVNTYDTGLLEKRLSTAGFARGGEAPHVHILNTCAVTAEATKEAQRWIRRIKAKDPLALVVVTGCAAQVDTDRFAGMKGADLIVANSHKGQLEDLIRQHYSGQLKERIFKSNIFKKLDLEEGGGLESQHTRTFLKIQDGCNSFCTYCVIPFARGKSRSLPLDTLVRRIQELESQGVGEVVLTGVHIGDYLDEKYGSQAGPEVLLKEILKRTQMGRIRVSSLEPLEVSDELLEIYQDPRMCPHFHMSIQSACGKILHDMKRQYTAKDVETSLQQIYDRVPGVFVGMDVIAGFPGETPEDFKETLDRLRALPWTRIHVFPYSERPGTYAARLPDRLQRAEIMARSKDLRELSSDRYACEALAQIGSLKKVLTLAGQGAQGLSRDYWPVQIEGPSLSPGQELSVRILGYDHSDQGRMEGCLRGQVEIDATH